MFQQIETELSQKKELGLCPLILKLTWRKTVRQKMYHANLCSMVSVLRKKCT